ncbi:Phosphatidylinositol 4-kinase beta 1 [Zostera marina]|uniref:1-phosphatidylinositol 4-kinase n=1 Tax=Zostera marina TaxID=29655 RepID=A0A0K9P3L8_ZOSMR|nr:Phosphatidylinositol 4-kinase beta 1 [Zostera marina]
MVRILGLGRFQFESNSASPREIPTTNPSVNEGGGGVGAGGESGWLIRFFDSAFFCEWIAVSYLYKHDHSGVRDYLCNRMYTLPIPGIESYLFQICYMLIHKPSPSLDKFVIDMCSKSLLIALKVHWFLMAELEDSEDNEGISRIQEKCQIAATVMGEWPPLARPLDPAQDIETTPEISGKSSAMFNRLLWSKQKLLSLGSSSPSSSGNNNLLHEEQTAQAVTENTSSGHNNNNSDPNICIAANDGVLNNADSSSDSNSKISNPSEEKKFIQKLIPGPKMRDAFLFRKSMDKETEDSDKDGFFKRFLRDSKDKDEDDNTDKDSFFKRFLRDSKDKEEEDPDKDGFFKRFLKENRDKDEDDTDKDGFIKRILRENKDKEEDDNDKDGFFRRFSRENKDKGEDNTEKDGSSKGPRRDAKSEEDVDKDGFFKRLLRDSKDKGKDDLDNGFLKSSRKDKKILDEKESFFTRLFKDRQEEKKETEQNNADDEDRENGSLEEEENSDFLSSWRLFRVHPEESKAKTTSITENGSSTVPNESSPGTEKFFKGLFRDRDRSIEDSELLGLKKSKEKKHLDSFSYQDENYLKPPLPSTTSQIRKGTYHISLEFVQSLCDTSYGLVDIFPVEDRKKALNESLAEINKQIADAQDNGGTCFPMGKGMYQVINIPEDESVLLNSREKAPYLICVEVLKGESPSRTKEVLDSHKLSRGGIPLANGDAQLPKPPPWAYPLSKQRDINIDGSHDTERMLKSTSDAIDQAMSHLWETRIKFVHVSLTVEKQSLHGSYSNAETASGQDIQNDGGQISTVNSDFECVRVSLSAVPGVKMEDVDDQEAPRKKEHRRVPSTIAIEEVKAAAAKGQAPLGLPLMGAGQDSSDVHLEVSNGDNPKPTDALSGELWEVKKERIRRSSVFGKSPGWDLRSVIVKSGDDCRQEHLAVQLISHFYDIFQEAGLPLWLRPYEVLVTSSYTALIETIPDTASLHAMKSRFPNIISLRDFFAAKYQENSPNFKLAQRNFVESMAGYSILCYLLQVKDRHNGNLLLDEEGHIIHIDFGFMLSNSPGGVNFESAPFKLTRELLEVMDSDAEGNPSEFFDYFKVLCIQGFLTCRKHAERIILLVEMLQDSGFPCFRGGPRAIQNLRKRFHLSLTEEQCVSLVLSLISSSLDAWRTRQYDYYQRVLNGIL